MTEPSVDSKLPSKKWTLALLIDVFVRACDDGGPFVLESDGIGTIVIDGEFNIEKLICGLNE